MKKLLVSLGVLLLLTNTVYSQIANDLIQWQKEYSWDSTSVESPYMGILYPTVREVIADDGSLLLGSYYQHIMADTVTDAGMVIIKTDADGNTLWKNKLQGSSAQFTSMLHTQDGGVLVTGFITRSDGDFSDNPVGNGFYDAFLVKFNNMGAIEWKKYIAGGNDDFITSVFQKNDGNYIISGHSFSQDGVTTTYNIPANGTSFVMELDKTTQQTTTLQLVQLLNPAVLGRGKKIAVTKRNNTGYITTSRNVISPYGTTLTSLNDTNGISWSKVIPDSFDIFGTQIDADNNIYTLERDYFVVQRPRCYVRKTDDQGNEVFLREITPNYSSSLAQNLRVNQDGSFYFYTEYNQAMPYDHILSYYDAQGTKIWEQYLQKNSNQEYGNYNVYTNKDNEVILVGARITNPENVDISVVKLNSPKGYITGNVYLDIDTNCVQDSTDNKWDNRFVQVTGITGLYGVTDTVGNFTIPVRTIGDFTIQPVLRWLEGTSNCYTPITASITITQTIASIGAIPVSIIHNCPSMQVTNSLATVLRRCFNSTYHVQYRNDGFAVADSAYVDIVLDENMTFVNSLLPSIDVGNNVRRFQLGNVAGETGGSFTYNVYLACGDSTILGQTHCVTAHIYPDVPCIAVPNSANLEINATCEGDSILFRVRNISTVPANNIPFFVYEDIVLERASTMNITANATTTLAIPANGQSTYRLELPNPMGTVTNGSLFGAVTSSAAVEACNATTTFNTGNVTPYSTPDDQPWLDINCEQNRGSYDPNDKTGMPAGLGENHDITANDAIEYKIRFQNTGTDTAFTVVIRDTLDVDLDAATIEFGAGSHAYTPQINGQGAIKFTFTNILLPDSNTNEPASNGFVSFRIKQKANNPVGTVIHNTAAIYFDFNPPVITNTTTHTINNFNRAFTLSILPTKNSLISIKAYPNPFTESTTLDLGEKNLSNVRFTLYDMTGKIVKQQTYENTNQIILQKDNLTEGIYLYTIYHEGKAVATGKLVVK